MDVREQEVPTPYMVLCSAGAGQDQYLIGPYASMDDAHQAIIHELQLQENHRKSYRNVVVPIRNGRATLGEGEWS